jgi:CheY-like chemotaxis protein/HPt (histidine-containing phosphotransfer) domain-containing protein
MKQEAERLGAAGCTYKPLKPSHLHDAIVRVLAGTGALPARTASESQIDPTLGARLPLRILLAEDNVINQRVALLLLARLGYRADVAADGQEVLEAVARRSYDVVLMDVQMPEIDGLEATRRIRALMGGGGPRIVAMTANAMQGDREACLAAGMNDFITKPIEIHELVAALRRAAGERVRTTPGGPRPRLSVSGSLRRSGLMPIVALDAIDETTFARLRSLAAADGDETLGRLIDEHLVNSFSLMETMRAALTQDDATALERAAHSLKSSAAMFGCVRLSERCAELERAVAGGDADEVMGRFAALEEEYTRARSALEARRRTL